MGGEVNCSVCIGGGSYESPEFFNESIVKSRKEHKCCECFRVIPKGLQYQHISGKWDGYIETYKTCMDCKYIRDGLSCGGVVGLGELWFEVYEVFGDVKSTACLAKIETASAKAFFLDKWREWKGLE